MYVCMHIVVDQNTHLWNGIFLTILSMLNKNYLYTKARDYQDGVDSVCLSVVCRRVHVQPNATLSQAGVCF